MIEITRYTTNSERLFGSAVKTNAGISLSIHRGMRKHNLHQDWYHAEARSLIEVNMTEAQFASMITSLNIGGGVPCTIQSLDGEYVKREVGGHSEAEMIHEDIKAHVKDFKGKLGEATKNVKKVLDSSRITQKDRREIDHALEVLVAEIASNLPFLMEQFQESVDSAVMQAKTEIASFADRALREKGLEGLKASAPQLGIDDPKVKT
jgi:hypothetical protein